MSRPADFSPKTLARITGALYLLTIVLEAGGGRFLARGVPFLTLEGVENQRAVVIEFDSVNQAVATYESSAYQAALEKLQGAVERDVLLLDLETVRQAVGAERVTRLVQLAPVAPRFEPYGP